MQEEEDKTFGKLCMNLFLNQEVIREPTLDKHNIKASFFAQPGREKEGKYSYYRFIRVSNAISLIIVPFSFLSIFHGHVLIIHVSPKKNPNFFAIFEICIQFLKY